MPYKDGIVMDISPKELLEPFTVVAQSGLRDWGSLHPLIIHFPIALLLIAPIFILLGLVFRKSLKIFSICSLILMWLGTAAIFLSVFTGEAASRHLPSTTEILETFEEHAEFAEQTRLAFVILTILWTLYVVLLLPKPSKPMASIHWGFLSLFLIGYTYSVVLLLNTAHYGGKLVHHHGVHTNLYETPH